MKRPLPKTEDGVLIIPPITVYRIDIHDYIEAFKVTKIKWDCKDDNWVLYREPVCETPIPRIFQSGVYSTYKAAVAAIND